MKLTAIDLFCGCGGFTKGMNDAGIDVWDKAIESHDANNNCISLCKDLTQYSPQQFARETEIKKKRCNCWWVSMSGVFSCK